MTTHSESMNIVRRRLLKIWQVLISRARNRQTITYGELALLIGEEGIHQRNLGPYLNHIVAFSMQAAKKDLTVIVVRQDTGKPSKGNPMVAAVSDVDKEREEVFKIQWFSLTPPTPGDFPKETLRFGRFHWRGRETHLSSWKT